MPGTTDTPRLCLLLPRDVDGHRKHVGPTGAEQQCNTLPLFSGVTHTSTHTHHGALHDKLHKQHFIINSEPQFFSFNLLPLRANCTYVPVWPKTEHIEYDKNHRKWFLSLKLFSSFYLCNSEFTLKKRKKSTSTQQILFSSRKRNQK